MPEEEKKEEEKKEEEKKEEEKKEEKENCCGRDRKTLKALREEEEEAKVLVLT